jgi:hypothetical protein
MWKSFIGGGHSPPSPKEPLDLDKVINQLTSHRDSPGKSVSGVQFPSIFSSTAGFSYILMSQQPSYKVSYILSQIKSGEVYQAIFVNSFYMSVNINV